MKSHRKTKIDRGSDNARKTMQLKRKFTPNTPGLFESLDADVYRKAPGLSKSALAVFAECPAKYKAMIDGKIQRKATKAMEYGTLLHAAILDGEFNYHVRPDTYIAEVKGAPVEKEWNSNATACLDWISEHSDKPIVKSTEDAEIRAVARCVRKHPLAAPLLKHTRREVSMFAEYDGRMMKGRADGINAGGWLLDIKKTVDASTRALSRAIHQYKYHLQAALYWKLCAINNVQINGFYFIAIELGDTTGDACLLNVRQLTPAAMEQGQRELDRLLAELRECEESGVWPDYSGHSVDEIDLPHYAYDDETIDLIG